MTHNVHNEPYFLKHCEICALLLRREDRDHPAIKYHIRTAIREASNHVAYGPRSGKHSAEFMSIAARDQMFRGKFTDLVAEHIIPVSVLTTKATEELTAPTTESIAQLLREHAKRAVITREEDQRLSALGLGKTMPAGDFLSRYKASGIELVRNEYSKLFHEFQTMKKSSDFRAS